MEPTENKVWIVGNVNDGGGGANDDWRVKIKYDGEV
jgi:hypothetical protein